MARTPQQIEEEDKKKANLGVDDELEEIEIDTLGEGKEGTVVGEVEPTAEEVAADLKKQLDESNAKLAKERGAREAAETRANKSTGDANNSRQAQIAAQEQGIKDRVGAATTKLESIKQQLKQAKANQDNDAEVELSDAMAEARFELNSAKWEEGQFSKWKEGQKNVRPAAAEQNTSPYTPAEQEWIDDHPEFYTDKKFARLTKVLAAEALEEGHKQDSRAFFTYVEQGLRDEGFLTKEPTSGAGDAPARKTTTSTGAPPNRTGNGSAPIVRTNAKYPFIPKGFRIPADWVQSATDQGFDDPLEYANMRLEDEAKSKGVQ
jgi:hypothetical protein